MKILSLGHSCFLLEMTPGSSDAPVRVLADPWLDDYLAGDLLGRLPRVRIEWSRLAPIHGIFLSHSHTDHCDPYSLVTLFKTLDPRPALLLPESLRFLESLFREHLEGVEILYLEQHVATDFHGLEISAFFNPETGATNEDDVMVLVARTERDGGEVFLSESDAILPLYHPAGREIVAEILDAGEPATKCFLTTRNEGEATLSSLAARNREDRLERRARSVELTTHEVEELYEPHDEGADLWGLPGLVRLVAGQGIGIPRVVDSRWNHVLFPITRGERVELERRAVDDIGLFDVTIEDFVPGHEYVLSRGALASGARAEAVELLDTPEDQDFDPDLELFESFPTAPLRDEDRVRENQHERILECLNRRFLPHLIGARNPPVEHLLAERGGEYRVRIRYGTSTSFADREYAITFARLRFHEVERQEGEANEHYWANDLEDIVEGRADEFSTVCRHPLDAEAMRFWLSLGLPYLNNDLIEKKLRLHFERATSGETLESWVLPFWGR